MSTRQAVAATADGTELGFECHKCGNYYNRKESRDRHLNTVHSDARPYQCSYCERSFNLQANCNRHEKVVHDKDGFRTQMYGSSVTYDCDICGKSFRRKESRRRHYIIHTGDQPFPCRYCDLSFNISGNRRRHEVTQHEQRVVDSAELDEGMEGSQNVRPTTSSKRKFFSCPLCGLEFMSDSAMEDHKNSVDCQLQRNQQVFSEIMEGVNVDGSLVEGKFDRMHSDSPKKHRSSKGRKGDEQPRFGCGYCNKTFKLPLSCLRHEMKVHGVAPE